MSAPTVAAAAIGGSRRDDAAGDDTLIVPALDRLGHSIQGLLSIVSGLRKQGIGFTSLYESLDTTTPGGRLVFHVFAVLVEFMAPGHTHEGLSVGLSARLQPTEPASEDDSS